MSEQLEIALEETAEFTPEPEKVDGWFKRLFSPEKIEPVNKPLPFSVMVATGSIGTARSMGSGNAYR